MQTGWSSERVPLHASANRRQLSSSGVFPYNNGRALPSKWEDAERWIVSPVSGDGLVRTSLPQPHKRPKAKSGPLGPPGVAYYSQFSPAVPVIDGGNLRNFTVGSPFSAAVFAADRLDGRANYRGVGFPVRTDPCMARSVSVHGCSEVVAQASYLPSQGTEDKVEYVKDAATDISRVVSRRDMATQMSPASSSHSSPSKRLSLMSSTPSVLPIVEVKSFQYPKSEVRDVQVDETVTVTRWSRKHRGSNHIKGSEIFDWRKKVVGCRSSAWEISETSVSFSKSQREEAKISAWENLQNAKAEAAIRKLEMKLEKKRSSSMKRIMKKLRSAQKRAQEMRSSVVVAGENEGRQVSSSSEKKTVSLKKKRQMGVLSGCFACPAF
ncbi:Remorin 4.1 [Linum grandiflorum]